MAIWNAVRGWMMVVGTLAGIAAFAQEPNQSQSKDPSDSLLKLKAMSDFTSLAPSASGGVRPWHWTMNVLLYDFEGKNPKTGTIEAWAANGNMRSVMTLGDEHLVTLRLGDKLYRSAGDAKSFTKLETVFMNALEPVPASLLDPSIKLKQVQRVTGSNKLDCIEPVFVDSGVELNYVDGPKPAFCTLAGSSQFVGAYLVGQTLVTPAQFGHFQSKQVPILLEISQRGVKWAECKTTLLTTFTPTPADFGLDPSLHPLATPVEVSAEYLLQSMVFDSSQRIDPPSDASGTKQANINVQISLESIVGIDGKVISMSVLKTSNDDFAQTFARVAKHRVYLPYRINGLPVEFKAAIQMRFDYE